MTSRDIVIGSMGKGPVIVGLFAALLCPQAAAAQDAEVDPDDAEARSLFDAGSLAFTQGRYQEALERFVRAHELSGRPELLYNIATAHDRLRNDEAALEHFERFLAEAPDTPRRAEVEARIQVLRRQIEQRAAPTPEETARAAPVLPSPAQPPRAEESSGSTLWIWAVGGALVVGAAVVVVVLLAGGGTQDPIDGDGGVTWTTLRGAP